MDLLMLDIQYRGGGDDFCTCALPTFHQSKKRPFWSSMGSSSLLYQSPPILKKKNLCISFNRGVCPSSTSKWPPLSPCCWLHFFFFYIFLLISSENYLGPNWRPCVILTCDSTILSPRLRRHRWKNLCPQLSLPETDPHIFYTGGAQVTRTEGHVTSSHQRPHFSLLSHLFLVCSMALY